MEKENGWGYIDVTSMSWDGQDLTTGFRFESPDDGNPDDRTVLSVALPRPVAPGETAALKISWKAKAPRVFARAGYVRDFYFVGQWFPKIGVLEPAGSRRHAAPAWNCHQYHANSEFFADWGDYRVAMTVPESFVVGSAGTKVGESRAGGRKTLVYELKDVHDFAWTADPRFVVKESLFDPAKDIPKEELERASKTLGRTPEELLRGFRPVKLLFYMQPEHAAAWRKHEDAQKWALAWFGLWAFPYPVPAGLDGRPAGGRPGRGGMEYQTLYTTADSKWLGFWPGSGLHVPEMVTIHEFGHGYWYGMLASNEFEESWMDEGIASFTEAVIVDRHYPWYYGLPWGVGVHDEELQRLIVGRPDFDPILRNSWSYHGERSYGRNSYERPATVIQQIRRLAGEEKFWRAFRAYAERWRWDRPTTEDFLDAMRSTGIPRLRGLRPEDLLSAPPSSISRFSGRRARPTTRSPVSTTPERRRASRRSGRGKEEGRRPVPDRRRRRPGRRPRPSRRRSGSPSRTGQSGRRRGTARAKWLRLRTVYGSKLARVDVDPDRKIVLDRNPWNNVRVTGKLATPSAAAKVRAYAFHLVEILLSSLWSVA